MVNPELVVLAITRCRLCRERPRLVVVFSATVSNPLFEIADGQQGYFTARQATDAGCQPGGQAHHTKSGNWVRVGPGICRLARFHQSAKE